MGVSGHDYTIRRYPDTWNHQISIYAECRKSTFHAVWLCSKARYSIQYIETKAAYSAYGIYLSVRYVLYLKCVFVFKYVFVSRSTISSQFGVRSNRQEAPLKKNATFAIKNTNDILLRAYTKFWISTAKLDEVDGKVNQHPNQNVDKYLFYIFSFLINLFGSNLEKQKFSSTK